jgi:phage virion morphogenesis protein
VVDNINIKIDDQELKRQLEEMARATANLSPALRYMGEIALESIERNFEEGGRPDAWADLSEATKAIRKKMKKWPGQILVRKGKAGGLMGALAYNVQPKKLVMTANKVYATTHHYGAKAGEFGTKEVKIRAHIRNTRKGRVHVRAHERRMKIPWGDIPARSFMIIQTEDWGEMREALGRHIMRESIYE